MTVTQLVRGRGDLEQIYVTPVDRAQMKQIATPDPAALVKFDVRSAPVEAPCVISYMTNPTKMNGKNSRFLASQLDTSINIVDDVLLLSEERDIRVKIGVTVADGTLAVSPAKVLEAILMALSAWYDEMPGGVPSTGILESLQRSTVIVP